MRLTVNGILRQDAHDGLKAEALRQYVKLGQPLEEIEKWCGPAIAAEGAEGQPLGFADCDLVVQCDAANKVRSFGSSR
jgi:hypothetical protein